MKEKFELPEILQNLQFHYKKFRQSFGVFIFTVQKTLYYWGYVKVWYGISVEVVKVLSE